MSHHKNKLMLLTRLRELGARLTEIEQTLLKEHSRDWEEMAVEREDEEMLESLGTASQAEIGHIRRALERLNEGSYGYCDKCGEEIAPARLEAVPYAVLCHACASGKTAA
ncbi:TraR/DksA family transcriptional regulator [Pacificoceanicola onchidii]|uniref:TraR/DksA family transcriptional regulator n=1 Tax=Pacificoceanicola onchidii TaxID=2562685 RepID=UPI0010A546A4|nr:TraR/DksA family transcriptional regulator [Pacificoceanicola onchidii]